MLTIKETKTHPFAGVEGERELFRLGIDAAYKVLAELEHAHELRLRQVLDTHALTPALEQDDKMGPWGADVEIEREGAVLEQCRARTLSAVSTASFVSRWIVDNK